MSAFDGTNGPILTVQFVKSGTWTSADSTHVKSIDINRGRPRNDYTFDAGTATIVFDNTSGIYDPDITTGTWSVSGVSIIRAGLQVRVIATWSGVAYILFAGFLESAATDQGFEPTVALSVVDGLAIIGRAYAPPLSVTRVDSTDNELASTRVTRMLDDMGWPSADRSISTGTVHMLMAAQGRQSIEIINECAACEVGDFFVSRDGKATFRVVGDKFSAVTRLEFSDARPQPANTIEYDSLETRPGTEQLINQAVVKRQEKTEYTATYSSSASSYGITTASVTAPAYYVATAKKIAWLMARKDSSPDTRLTSVGFTSLGLGALYPDFLALELLDQVTVHRTTVDGRTLTWYVVVQGIHHSISADGWTTTLSTSPMNPYTFS